MYNHVSKPLFVYATIISECVCVAFITVVVAHMPCIAYPDPKNGTWIHFKTWWIRNWKSQQLCILYIQTKLCRFVTQNLFHGIYAMSKPKTGGPPILCCSEMLLQYIWNTSSIHLEAISSRHPQQKDAPCYGQHG